MWLTSSCLLAVLINACPMQTPPSQPLYKPLFSSTYSNTSFPQFISSFLLPFVFPSAPSSPQTHQHISASPMHTPFLTQSPIPFPTSFPFHLVLCTPPHPSPAPPLPCPALQGSHSVTGNLGKEIVIWSPHYLKYPGQLVDVWYFTGEGGG